MTVPVTDRVGYKEIFSTLLLKTVPLIAIIAIVYKYAIRSIEMNGYFAALAQFLFGLALFLAIRLTAWGMLKRLIREANPK